MDVEVYQYLMSRSGVGSTGAGFFIDLIAGNLLISPRKCL